MATPNTSALQRDVNSVPIPQGWNPVTSQFMQVNCQDGILYSSSVPDSTGAFAYPTVYRSSALEALNQVKNVGGVIYQISVINTATSGTFYFQLFNSTTAPTSGSTVPNFSITLPNGQTTFYTWAPFGVYFANGIYFAVSTTPVVYTSGAGNLFGVYVYAA